MIETYNYLKLIILTLILKAPIKSVADNKFCKNFQDFLAIY